MFGATLGCALRNIEKINKYEFNEGEKLLFKNTTISTAAYTNNWKIVMNTFTQADLI